MVTALLIVREGMGTTGIMFMNLNFPDIATVTKSPGSRLVTVVETPECVPLTVMEKVPELKAAVCPSPSWW